MPQLNQGTFRLKIDVDQSLGQKIRSAIFECLDIEQGQLSLEGHRMRKKNRLILTSSKEQGYLIDIERISCVREAINRLLDEIGLSDEVQIQEGEVLRIVPKYYKLRLQIDDQKIQQQIMDAVLNFLDISRDQLDISSIERGVIIAGKGLAIPDEFTMGMIKAGIGIQLKMLDLESRVKVSVDGGIFQVCEVKRKPNAVVDDNNELTLFAATG